MGSLRNGDISVCHALVPAFKTRNKEKTLQSCSRSSVLIIPPLRLQMQSHAVFLVNNTYWLVYVDTNIFALSEWHTACMYVDVTSTKGCGQKQVEHLS